MVNRAKSMNERNAEEWAEEFANHFREIVGGEGDLADLIDWAKELYPTRGHQAPGAAAHEEWKAGEARRLGLTDAAPPSPVGD
jgi:hypothetical protein